MMARILNITINFDQDIEEKLRDEFPDVGHYRILSKSLDARGARHGRVPTFKYRIEVGEGVEGVEDNEVYKIKTPPERPIIIGAGPAGLFCALKLLDHGISSIIIERGECVQNRMKHISKFWRHGEFNSENNVCFGEGGAGLFSDGKLITRIKSHYVKYVLNRFVDFGAPKEIAYLSNPHLGSNIIRKLISKITSFLKSSGCEIYYNTKMEKLIISDDDKIEGIELMTGKKLFSPNVILATGHSARDVYRHLDDLKIEMTPKDFAVGVRVEHQRELIDYLQYGKFAGKQLGAAKYRLSHHDKKTGRGTYSFCMCPGGYVLSAGTEEDGIVVNGMSNYAQNSRWSNSALVVSVKANEDFFKLGGIDFQREIEKKAYLASKGMASGKELPAENILSFLEDGKHEIFLNNCSSPSGIFPMKLSSILPAFVVGHLQHALLEFEKKINGFISKDAVLIAPETRTSAPVVISRDKRSLMSSNCTGLYPCGEGAGLAGGITSAAVDGVKVAMAIIKGA